MNQQQVNMVGSSMNKPHTHIDIIKKDSIFISVRNKQNAKQKKTCFPLQIQQQQQQQYDDDDDFHMDQDHHHK